MEHIGKFLYLLISLLIIANIISVVYNWNTYENYSFLGFDLSKYYYLPLQFLFAWVFITRYLELRKKDNNKNV